MNFYVMTLFPDIVMQGLSRSITGRAMENGLISVHAVNIRDYAKERHKKTDDYPFGGGYGMLMQVQPIDDCFRAICREIGRKKERPTVLYMSPQGRVFDQEMAKELSKKEDLIFLCGRYEGVDERALWITGAKEVSLGDFVVTGGELPAMVMIDCISRLVPGVISPGSIREETFKDGLLEYPQFTRPENYKGLKVPSVLLSGHHENIRKWKRIESVLMTLLKRPELLENATLSPEEKRLVDKLMPRLYPGEDAKGGT